MNTQHVVNLLKIANNHLPSVEQRCEKLKIEAKPLHWKLPKILVSITMQLLKNFTTICEKMIRKHTKVYLHLLMVSIKEW
jgi:hypothetical protein